VVTGDDHVELAAGGAYEERVGRERSDDVDAFASGGLNRGRDAVTLLEPEQAFLACVGIESSHRDT
jgi:hypothetical protein